MSIEILDCLKRQRDICVTNAIPSQNTAFMFTPALIDSNDDKKLKSETWATQTCYTNSTILTTIVGRLSLWLAQWGSVAKRVVAGNYCLTNTREELKLLVSSNNSLLCVDRYTEDRHVQKPIKEFNKRLKSVARHSILLGRIKLSRSIFSK